MSVRVSCSLSKACWMGAKKKKTFCQTNNFRLSGFSLVWIGASPVYHLLNFLSIYYLHISEELPCDKTHSQYTHIHIHFQPVLSLLWHIHVFFVCFAFAFFFWSFSSIKWLFSGKTFSIHFYLVLSLNVVFFSPLYFSSRFFFILCFAFHRYFFATWSE